MALHKDFPDDPHAILDPSIRWFPADEALRETTMDKLMPPLVVPKTTGRYPAGFQPDCCQASWAAISNSLAARSIRFSSRSVKRVTGRVFGKATSAATFTRCRETSNNVTGRIATRPARKPSALVVQPWPKAVMTPAPVMTTRGGGLGGCGAGNNTDCCPIFAAR